MISVLNKVGGKTILRVFKVFDNDKSFGRAIEVFNRKDKYFRLL